MITGKDLIAWGHQPGGWFGDAIAAANSAASEGMELEGVKALVDGMKPPPVIPLRPPDRAAFAQMIEAETPDEQRNVEQVIATMTELMRTPTLKGGAVMPDACPAGGMGR